MDPPKWEIAMNGHRLSTKIGWEQTRPTSDLPVFTVVVGVLRELAPEDFNSPLVLFEQFISLINQACQQTHMHVFCSAPSGSQESAIPAS